MILNHVEDFCSSPADEFTETFHFGIGVEGLFPDKSRGTGRHTKRSVLNGLESVLMTIPSHRTSDGCIVHGRSDNQFVERDLARSSLLLPLVIAVPKSDERS